MLLSVSLPSLVPALALARAPAPVFDPMQVLHCLLDQSCEQKDIFVYAYFLGPIAFFFFKKKPLPFF